MTTLTTKHCRKCDKVKPVDDFNKCSRNTDGRQSSCKTCKKKLSKERYLLNKDHIKETNQAWSKRNRDRHDELRKDWRKKESNGRLTELTKTGHAPIWLTSTQRNVIKAIYREAKKQKLVVDHIIPLRGETVCGLHVPENLQLLSYRDNQLKSNHF